MKAVNDNIEKGKSVFICFCYNKDYPILQQLSLHLHFDVDLG
jgi:hypothetical protein